MTTSLDHFMRRQLLNRRRSLEHAAKRRDASRHIQFLLEEVDSALARMEDGSFGICESCHDSIECDRLIADPLVRFCLDHLSGKERNALEEDLELAARVQRGLLPTRNLDRYGWHVCYHYEPAGIVSGDYCDVIDGGDCGLYFMVGDVSGKGVAASMLMAQLHAMFRTLISVGLPLGRMLEHASSVFSGSTLPSQYATLVCGRALPDGKIEICNAGHPSPLLVGNHDVTPLEGSDLPIGLFGSEAFTVTELSLQRGQGIVIYSDGVPEATDFSGEEYGVDRLRKLIGRGSPVSASTLLEACRDDLVAFRRDSAKTDDVTLFVLSRGNFRETNSEEEDFALEASMSAQPGK